MLLFLLLVVVSIATTALQFYDADSESVNPGSNPDQFKAQNALTKGNAFWSSEADIGTDQEIFWRAWFQEPKSISAVKIEWAYSPQQVKIVSSPDRKNEKVILDWRATPSLDPAFSEILDFPQPEVVEEIKVFMKGPLHQFFGITRIEPIAAGLPVFHIVAGITAEDAEGEGCVQVADGAFYEGGRLSLDTCVQAIAHGDGREIFQLLPTGQLSVPLTRDEESALCVAWVSSKKSDSHFALQNCDIAKTVFTFSGNGQIELLLTKKKQCVSVKGSGLGFTDLVQKLTPKVSATSVMDVDHSASSVTQPDLRFFWSSQAFSSPNQLNLVAFDAEFPEEVVVNKVEIDWEFPPLGYSVLGSSDGVDFIKLEEVEANPLNRTMDDVGRAKFKIIRISMTHVHPDFGKFAKGKYGYGIRQLRLLQNNVELSVAECKDAGVSADARDKFFKYELSRFDANLAKTLVQQRLSFSRIMVGIQSAAANVGSALPQIEKCKKTIETNTEQFSDLKNRSKLIQEKSKKALLALENGSISLKTKKAVPLIGLSKEYPASNCLAALNSLSPKSSKSVKSVNLTPNSGFFTLLAPCFPYPIRVMCDAYTKSGFFAWTGQSVGISTSSPNNGGGLGNQVKRLSDFVTHCAAMGLDPLSVTAARDFDSLKLMIQKSHLLETSNVSIPIAFDLECGKGVCSLQYKDLGTASDVSGMLMRHISNQAELMASTSGDYKDALVIQKNSPTDFGLTMTNWKSSAIQAVLCSVSNSNKNEFKAAIDCTSSADTSGVFQGGLNTNFNVQCPKDCQYHTSGDVHGGKDRVYSDSSAICKAAIHAGLPADDFTVTFESPHSLYPGSLSNGINSLTFGGPSKFAIRLGRTQAQCPVDSVKGELESGTGLVTTSKGESETLGDDGGEKDSLDTNKLIDKSSAALAESQSSSGHSYNNTPANLETSETAQTAQKLMVKLNSIDPHTLLSIRVSVAAMLSNGRGQVKSIETERNKLQLSLQDVFPKIMSIGESTYSLLSSKYGTLTDLKDNAKLIEKKKVLITGFTKWDMKELITEQTLLEELFTAHIPVLQATTTSSSLWSLSNEGPKLKLEVPAIIQITSATTNELGIDSTAGDLIDINMLLLKNKLFFDFETSFSLYVENSGDLVGLAWRVRDFINYYGVLIRPLKDSLQLKTYRVKDGVMSPLTEIVTTTAATAGEWIKFRIETRKGHQRISLMTPSSSDSLVVTEFYDEMITHGSIAFLAVQTSGEIFFATPEITPVCCTKSTGSSETSSLYPRPKDCSLFIDKHDYYIPSLLQILNHKSPEIAPIEDSNGGPHWQYASAFMGRPKVLLATIYPNSEINLAVFKSNHKGLCHQGSLLFEALPVQCPNAVIGAVINFIDIRNYVAVLADSDSIQVSERRFDRLALVDFIDLNNNKKNWVKSDRWTQFEVIFNSLSGFLQVRLDNEVVYESPSAALSSRSPLKVPHRVGLVGGRCSQIAYDSLSLLPPSIWKEDHEASFHPYSFRQRERALLPNIEKLSLNDGTDSLCTKAETIHEAHEICKQYFKQDDSSSSFPDSIVIESGLQECLEPSHFCSSCCKYEESFRIGLYTNCLSQCDSLDFQRRKNSKELKSALQLCYKENWSSNCCWKVSSTSKVAELCGKLLKKSKI